MKPFPGKNALPVLLFLMRFWFASLLVYSSFIMTRKDILYGLFNSIVSGHNLLAISPITYVAKIIEILLAFFLFIGLFTRVSSGILMSIMVIALVTSMAKVIDFGNSWEALAKILLAFAAIFLVYGAGKWSVDNYLANRNALAKK